MRIIQPLHAAILVSDLNRSEYFYGQILQLTTVDRPLNFPGIWYQVGDFEQTPTNCKPSSWGFSPAVTTKSRCSRWVSGTFAFIPLLAISAKELREKSLLPTKIFTQQMGYRNNYSLLEPHNLKFSWCRGSCLRIKSLPYPR